MISTITLKPYFRAAGLTGIVTALHATSIPRSRFLYEQIITPEVFEPAAIIFTVFLGLVLIATTPCPTLIRALVERVENRAFKGFSAIGGAMAGWGLAVCALHVYATGSAGIVLAVVLGGYTVILTLSPLLAFETVTPIVREYTQLRFRNRRGLAAINLIGWILTFCGLLGIWQWVVHG